MELHDKVVLSPWRADWAREFAELEESLHALLDDLAVRVDHIGSTSVPDLVAKDIIDLQVIVRVLDAGSIVPCLIGAGYRHKTQSWNLRDHVPAGWVGELTQWDKFVFDPPAGQRPSNIHVRVAGAANERFALLFRDFLRADSPCRQAWGQFKERLAARTLDLSAYGAVKDPATDVLMTAAEWWAVETAWAAPQG